MNKAIIVGRLGADPDVKTFESGNTIVTLSVATNHREYDKETEGYVKATAWHRVKVYGKRGAVIAEHLKKGSEIALEGRIDYRTWEKDDGTKGHSTEIVLSDFDFIGGRSGSSDSGGSSQGQAAPSTFGGSEEMPDW